MQNSHSKWLWLSAIVLLLDQLTKYWAEHILQGGVIAILPVFDLSLVHNTGAAFGFLREYGGWQHLFFGTLAIGVSAVLLYMIGSLKQHERHLAIAYSLIISGAIGNVIDRAIYQYVVDFLHVFYLGWHFPHFNIADSAIFIGAFLIITEAFGKPFLNSPKLKNEPDL
jgi:signal peptidase II